MNISSMPSLDNHLILLTAQAAASCYMMGLIWFVQLVHYPLLGKVGRDTYAEYHRSHTFQTGFAVIPAMLIELGCAVLLVIFRPSLLTITGISLVALIWASTFLLQVPQHAKLEKGFDQQAHRRLVHTNWIRTLLWTARAALGIWMITM